LELDSVMIKGYKLYAKKEKFYLVLLEYGQREIALEEIVKSIEATGIGIYDETAVKDAFSSGVKGEVEMSPSMPSDLPAACWIEFDENGDSAKVNLYPPLGNGRTLSESDVRRELDDAGCSDFFFFNDVFRRNLESHRKAKVPVIFKAAEKRNAEIIAEIASDRRTAFINYHHPWGGKNFTYEEALAKLEEQNVKFGINEARLREILENEHDVEQQRIAGAKESVRGADATIAYLFDAYHAKSGPKVSEETGCVDYRDLSLFENVEPGSPLARKNPITMGEDGMDITGIAIKAEAGKDVQLPKGKNTCVSPDDPDLLIAQLAGTPKLVNGKINVDDMIVVEDVDFSTGNINFNGDVLVKGIVNAGFTIDAGGDITCKDAVESANLTAKGNIYLKRGIKGMNRSKVNAGLNVYAKFIENCTVYANESVIVEEEIMHSVVLANERVEVTHPKGVIMGGTTKARELIRSPFIGSDMAVKTNLEVGIAPHLKEQIDDLSDSLTVKLKDLEKASKNLYTLNNMREKNGLAPEREELFHQLGNITTQLKAEVEEIAENIAELEGGLRSSAGCRVEAKKTIYPGVIITIKNAKMRISEPINKAVFVKDGPDVVLSTEVPQADKD